MRVLGKKEDCGVFYINLGWESCEEREKGVVDRVLECVYTNMIQMRGEQKRKKKKERKKDN
jgi:hypothetical protein